MFDFLVFLNFTLTVMWWGNMHFYFDSTSQKTHPPTNNCNEIDCGWLQHIFFWNQIMKAIDLLILLKTQNTYRSHDILSILYFFAACVQIRTGRICKGGHRLEGDQVCWQSATVGKFYISACGFKQYIQHISYSYIWDSYFFSSVWQTLQRVSLWLLICRFHYFEMVVL